MNKLTERDIIAPFIGKSINQEHFSNIGDRNGGNYFIRNVNYIDKPQYLEMFGITDHLEELWGCSGIDFSLCLTLEDWTITKCHIDKCRYGGGHGRPIIKVLSISQQELRVARRILQYITKF